MQRFFIRVCIILVLLCYARGWTADEILIADFEEETYSTWRAEGTAFGTGPAAGTLPNQMQVSGFLGKRLVNSYTGGDASTGILTSAEFKIQKSTILFLIGGGKNPGKTCLNLVVGGQVVRTATGSNDKPGGSERLEWHGWDVREFIGTGAMLTIVDTATGGWGHINVDQILQTDRPAPVMLSNAAKQLVVRKRYLNLPVKTGAPKRRMSVKVEGAVVREFEIELADQEPEFWSFLDLAPFKAKELIITADQLRSDSRALESIEQSDRIRGGEKLYGEPLRPQFHFSSRRGWNNDPNGMVYFQGEYHLYYQHNPYGWDWGNMHWGHAVSRDLVHWKELPIAIYPRAFGDWAFSGSAVVDRRNTSGFAKGKDPVLVAAYTSTGRGECIVYSNDRGRTWNEYEKNPVVVHEGRDPRLLWHNGSGQWVMAVYDEQDKGQNIAFYTSPDLKQWEYQSRVPGFFECPDLFELGIEGVADKRLWVLTAASSEYMLGDFDGRTFKPSTPKLAGHRGNAFYAAQTFSDMPGNDPRRIQIGWGRMPTPGMPFNQMMCFPCELTLAQTQDGPRLRWRPVKEIELLRRSRRNFQGLSVGGSELVLPGYSAELMDLSMNMDASGAEVVTIRVRGIPVEYDFKNRKITCSGASAPLASPGGIQQTRILVDRTSVEIFADDGLVYMPISEKPSPANRTVGILASGGSVRLQSIQAHELKSTWRGEFAQ